MKSLIALKMAEECFNSTGELSLKVFLGRKALGTIRWNRKGWDLSELPEEYQNKLRNKRVGVYQGGRKGDVYIDRVRWTTPKDPLWGFQLCVVLSTEEDKETHPQLNIRIPRKRKKHSKDAHQGKWQGINSNGLFPKY
jgi:hypothetical protein